MKHFFLFITFAFFVFTSNAQWQRQTIDTKASFRGLSVVNQNVIWASGTGGTFLRSIDGGKNWTARVVPGAEKLDFRDVDAFDANTAYLLSIGNGEASRIYKTTDGGKTWVMQFKAADQNVFLDAFAFWDKDHGIAMGDPVKGYFYLLRTDDGGKKWYSRSTDKMFPAKDGEAAFAASGTCIFSQGKSNVWLVSGGKAARVHYSLNRGRSWIARDAPIISGENSQGIFSIAMFDAKSGIIIGGDYQKPNETFSNLALTSDGGKTWKESKGLSGFRSGAAFLDRNTIVVVGSSGSDISKNGGKSWENLDRESYNAIQSQRKNAIWAVGANGLVAKLKIK